MDRPGCGRVQMLAVGHGFVCFISDIGFKIFPVCTCVKELFPAAQDFLLRHRHPDLAMIIEAVKNRHLIDLLHIRCLYEGDT